MNKTKRKIFEIAMELFAKKGYNATSIEEITAMVGVAKGTLYYHFQSKEQIFTFLIEEGMKLLKNSIEIKTTNLEKTVDKLRAIMLIQIKVMLKYKNFISILVSEMWGDSARNVTCKKYIYEYIDNIKEIIQMGIDKNEIKNDDAEKIAIRNIQLHLLQFNLCGKG
jgi:AcrR family transcriptional regulator